jgi:hypothetical protein
VARPTGRDGASIADMEIGITDDAVELVRARGGTVAIDYIHAIG